MAEKIAFIDKIGLWMDQAIGIGLGWLTSPVVWSQFAIVGLGYLLGRLVSGRLSAILVHGIEALARYVLVLVAALYAVGLLDDILSGLDKIVVAVGYVRFSVLSLLGWAIVGSMLFWLVTWSNRPSADCIKGQTDLRPATRDLFAKAAEVVIFSAAFVLLMSARGIDLTVGVVLGGALGLGIGLGLQQIATKFGPGVILLIEGQTTVGDFVQLDSGERGTIVKLTARVCVLKTFDGKWTVVPNDHFIMARVVNLSDQGVDGGKNKHVNQLNFVIRNALKSAGIAMPYPHRVIEVNGGPVG